AVRLSTLVREGIDLCCPLFALVWHPSGAVSSSRRRVLEQPLMLKFRNNRRNFWWWLSVDLLHFAPLNTKKDHHAVALTSAPSGHRTTVQHNTTFVVHNKSRCRHVHMHACVSRYTRCSHLSILLPAARIFYLSIYTYAAETVPLARCARGQRGWYTSEAQHEISEASQEIKAAQ
ncbi:unnamed protein product, partial [Ectocarpus sp. 8 AP-2014]